MSSGANHVQQFTIIGDGAAWIWGIATAKCPHATQIVDRGQASWATWLDDAYIEVQRGRCVSVLGEHRRAAAGGADRLGGAAHGGVRSSRRGGAGRVLAGEATANDPLIPLSVFRSAGVWAANLVQALLTAGNVRFLLPLCICGSYSATNALEIGLAFLSLTMVVAGVSLRYASGLIARHGAGLTLLPGLGLVTAGLFMFAHVPVHGRYLPDMLPVMLVLGTGVGLAFLAVMALAMSSATGRDAGLASGLINTVQVGGALGLAVLAAIATSHTDRLREAGDPRIVA